MAASSSTAAASASARTIVLHNSTRNKLFVPNVGLRVTRGEFEKTLAAAAATEARLPRAFRVRKQPQSEWATISFDSVEERDRALELLPQIVKNKRGDPLAVFVDKRAEEMDNADAAGGGGGRTSGGEFKVTDADGSRTAQAAVSPLQDVPYAEQLERKMGEMQNVVRDVKRSIKKLELKRGVPKDALADWLVEYPHAVPLSERVGMQYVLDPIVPSPCIDGYRNKCDFTIGVDAEGAICVGFRLGNFRDGSVRVGSPDPCRTVPKASILIAKQAEDFIREKSIFSPFDIVSKQGAWRSVHVRTSYKTKQVLISFNVNIDAKPKESTTDQSKTLEDEVRELTKTLCEISLFDSLVLTGVLLYESTTAAHQVSLDQSTPKVIFGADYLVEELLDLKFQISPEAFFQVNTLGADALFTVVRNAALENVQRPCTIFDVCCGTGVIGLLMISGNKADQTIGIELSPFAIADAKRNAAFNNLSDKSHFLCSRAELVMSELLERSGEWSGWRRFTGQNAEKPTGTPEERAAMERAIASFGDGTNKQDMVAIVDPPRAGLHMSVIKALRHARSVKRVVYISCNPTGSFKADALALCRTGRKRGDPFRPIRSIPVDMFPHTEHCELVTVFERDVDPPRHPGHQQEDSDDEEGGKKNKKKKRDQSDDEENKKQKTS